MIRDEGQSTEQAVSFYRDWRSMDLSAQDRTMLEFAEKLSLTPWLLLEPDLEKLRAAGFTEENVVDIVLVASYRNFINRVHTALGLDPVNMRNRNPQLVDAISHETEQKQRR